MNEGFNNGTLHDALLHFINTDWPSHQCEASITLVGGRKITIAWRNVADIFVPHSTPWGESKYINKVYIEGDTHKIEMQSGDVITIQAKEFQIHY